MPPPLTASILDGSPGQTANYSTRRAEYVSTLPCARPIVLVNNLVLLVVVFYGRSTEIKSLYPCIVVAPTIFS